MPQVPPHHVSRAYSEAQNKIQLVKNEAIRHGGAANVGLQATAYVCLRGAIDTVTDAHEVAHVVQHRSPDYGRNNDNQPLDLRNNNNQPLDLRNNNNQPLDLRNNNNQPLDVRNNNNQQMMSPPAARTRADANLLLQGGFPAQMPVLNYREQSGGDDRLSGLERYSSAYSESGGTVYSEAGATVYSEP